MKHMNKTRKNDADGKKLSGSHAYGGGAGLKSQNKKVPAQGKM